MTYFQKLKEAYKKLPEDRRPPLPPDLAHAYVDFTRVPIDMYVLIPYYRSLVIAIMLMLPNRRRSNKSPPLRLKLSRSVPPQYVSLTVLALVNAPSVKRSNYWAHLLASTRSVYNSFRSLLNHCFCKSFTASIS